MQLLEAETRLSRDRLINVPGAERGTAPKGMLPFSTDWFMTWQPNFHSSLLHTIYRFRAARARESLAAVEV